MAILQDHNVGDCHVASLLAMTIEVLPAMTIEMASAMTIEVASAMTIEVASAMTIEVASAMTCGAGDEVWGNDEVWDRR